MPTTTDTTESPTRTVIIGSGLLDQEIAWRYDRAPLAPAAIEAEWTLLGVYADAELAGDPLAGEGYYQALTRALNAYNADNGSTDDWNTWRTPNATPEARIDALVRIMAHAQALLNERR